MVEMEKDATLLRERKRDFWERKRKRKRKRENRGEAEEEEESEERRKKKKRAMQNQTTTTRPGLHSLLLPSFLALSFFSGKKTKL